MTSVLQPKKRNVPVGNGGLGRSLGSEKSSANYFIKLLLLGDTGVGKSSLMFRFSEGEFKSGLIGTAGVDYKMKNIELGGKSVKIQIWDTAGQERYRTLTKAYYRGAAGIILVYDTTDQTSFNNVSYWLQKIKKHGDENVEIMLLGNKIDLINDVMVSEEEAKEVAQQNQIPYFQTSAKSAISVDKAFKTLLNNIIANEKLKEKITINDQNSHMNRLASIRLESNNRFDMESSTDKKQNQPKCC